MTAVHSCKVASKFIFCKVRFAGDLKTIVCMSSVSDSPTFHGFSDNIMLMSDSYKLSHWKQYPPKTEFVYSYFESRGGQFADTAFFGLQYILLRHLEGQVVTRQKILDAERFAALHFGSADHFNRSGWEHILTKHDGYLPISIRAVPEGEVVGNRNVLLTIVNTDPECFWLTNFLETLLVQVWYPCTVATSSREQKKVISRWLVSTGCSVDSLEWKLHDFGFRGVSSWESSGIGGLAHLVNFRGTDTMSACIFGSEYYGSEMAGFSIPASEHSTITSWGRDNELDAFRNMLEQYPEGAVACVSDSWDIFRATSDFWGKELGEMIMNRKGKLVIRPDSGDPPTVVIRVLDLLGGGESGAFTKYVTLTSTGHRLLPPQVRVIQGDGVDIGMIEKIYAAMALAGWAAENVGFGSGGALLQKLNRDTLKFAFKCSSVTIAGEEREVYKDPVTDPGKKSKKGKLALVRRSDGGWETVCPTGPGVRDELVEVFRNGKVLVKYNLEEIRVRAKIG